MPPLAMFTDKFISFHDEKLKDVILYRTTIFDLQVVYSCVPQRKCIQTTLFFLMFTIIAMQNSSGLCI